MKRFFKEAPSHLSLIWALMLLTFWITDRFNSAMAFINHPLTKGLLTLFALATMLMALILLTDRTSLSLPWRIVLSLPTFLLSAGLAVLPVLDHKNPRLLLFVNDTVKFYLLGVVLWGLFIAVFGICRRRAAWNKAIDSAQAKESST